MSEMRDITLYSFVMVKNKQLRGVHTRTLWLKRHKSVWLSCSFYFVLLSIKEKLGLNNPLELLTFLC